MAFSMLKIRRPLGRLIFNMGIAIPGKTVFLIETASWWQQLGSNYGRSADVLKEYFRKYKNVFAISLISQNRDRIGN